MNLFQGIANDLSATSTDFLVVAGLLKEYGVMR